MEEKNLRILITGGAGFFGINVIRHLLKKGFRSLTSLDIAAFDYPEKKDITVVTGDIRDRETVDRLVSQADVVIHAAAALPRCTVEEIRSTDVGGTRHLLEAGMRHETKRFVFISSTAVYG
ncbi:MAG: NAD-dependent epimerase/dehydratase family protein, partial [Spirochaetales bacterium]|nr:NAD-dependent epimerase/dehydratase family protein [Spirochaetales bacterium]